MHYVFDLLNETVFDDAALFVKHHEYRCVNLAEQLRLYSRLYTGDSVSGGLLHAAVVYHCGEKKECKGVAVLTKSGIFLHCIDETIPPNALEAFTAFFFSDTGLFKYLYAIAGSEEYTLFLEHFIGKEKEGGLQVVAVQSYYLMRCMKPCERAFLSQAAQRCNASLILSEVGEEYTETLFPLQFSYEQAEIAFEGLEMSADLCRLALRSRLRKYLTYSISVDAVPVAKAGLNAEGFHWVQLGGVYTVPEYRNKGLAAALIAALIQKCIPVKHGIALFVRKNNHPALRVYTKLGFSFCGSFRMCYYRKGETSQSSKH